MSEILICTCVQNDYACTVERDEKCPFHNLQDALKRTAGWTEEDYEAADAAARGERWGRGMRERKR
jgi:NTP pyrophosphatase (non-canonical NTP hydrolase)